MAALLGLQSLAFAATAEIIGAAFLLLLSACGGEQEASYRVIAFEEARKYAGGGVTGGGSAGTAIPGYAGGELNRETCVWSLYIAGSLEEQAEEIATYQHRVSGPYSSCPQGYHFRIVEVKNDRLRNWIQSGAKSCKASASRSPRRDLTTSGTRWCCSRAPRRRHAGWPASAPPLRASFPHLRSARAGLPVGVQGFGYV